MRAPIRVISRITGTVALVGDVVAQRMRGGALVAIGLGALALWRTTRSRRAADDAERPIASELVDANRFLAAIIDNLPNMVFVKDAERLAFVRFNRAGELLLGLAPGALIGKTDHDLFDAEAAAAFQAKDRETLRSGELVDIPEEPIATPSGTRWLHTKKVPILGDDGAPRFLLGISEDITARKHAELELRRAKDAAEATSRELEAFSYSVSHDLRAPLRAIDGFSRALLERQDQLDATGQDQLRRVRAAAARMAELIDDLLGLAQVAQAPLRREPVDLGALAREVAGNLARSEPERTVEVRVADDLIVDGDRRLLRVVLENLLGNAWKFTSRRERATIELGRHDGAIFVRDDGAGFDMAYADRLFGAFQRLHLASEFEGTGIGLATVQRIIHRHGGRISAEGNVGSGATFTFTLGTST